MIMSIVFKRLMVLFVLFTSFFNAGCKSDGVFSTGADSLVKLEGISIRAFPLTTTGASVLTLAIGNQQAFEAIGHYSDGSSGLLTDLTLSDWQSSDVQVASFNQAGLLKAKSVGLVNVYVNKGSVKSNELTLTVTDAIIERLQLNSSISTLPIGLFHGLEVTAYYSDGTSTDETGYVDWEISDTNVAAMSRLGTIIGKSVGSVSIKAKKADIESNSLDFTINDAVISYVEASPDNATLAIGQRVQLSAFATYSNGLVYDVSPIVEWRSSKPDVAHVSSRRFVFVDGLSLGNALITPVIDSVLSYPSEIAVTDKVVNKIEVTPKSLELPRGMARGLIPTVIYNDGSTNDIWSEWVSWESDNQLVAPITRNGVVVAQEPGLADITASIDASMSEPVITQVTPAVPINLVIRSAINQLPVGFTGNLIAYLVMSDNTEIEVTQSDNLTWSSEDTSIVTVSTSAPMKGRVTGIRQGTTSINAGIEFNNQRFTAKIDLNVMPLTVAGATLSVKTDGVSSVPNGLTKQYSAFLTLADNSEFDVTKQNLISWTSDDPSIATISNDANKKGIVTAKQIGNTKITATLAFAGGSSLTANADLTVTTAVATGLALVPSKGDVPVGYQEQMKAYFTLSDGSTSGTDVSGDPKIVWSSSSSTIVEISNSNDSKGLASWKSPGTVKIGATFTDGETVLSAESELRAKDVTKSPIYGRPIPSNIISSYLLGESKKIELGCGLVVDRVVIPDSGQGAGGPGGGRLIITADKVKSIEIVDAEYEYIRWGRAITKITFTFEDNSVKVCGNDKDRVRNIQRRTWTPTDGEIFRGFITAPQATYILGIGIVSY